MKEKSTIIYVLREFTLICYKITHFNALQLN